MTHYGPVSLFSEQIQKEKHRCPGETFKDACSRIAAWLKDGDEHYHQFRDILLNQRFIPAGRIQSAAGQTETTAYNCFVSGTIADSLVHGENSITDAFKEAVTTMRLGGGIGYNFGTLRPAGDVITKLRSNSTGPISFMNIFDAGCRTISSSGHRRGAQMGVMPIDHPDIEEFIKAKQPGPEVQVLWDMVADMPEGVEKMNAVMALQNTLKLTGFNISIGATNEFMEHKMTGKPFKLRFNGKVYREVDPLSLWDSVMRSTWDWAEPGVLFMDTINRMNNLRYCETIAATNPCGEQPLPPYGACLLGSFNLVKYLSYNHIANIYMFDYTQLMEDVFAVVPAMDNVIDKSTYPLPQQKYEAESKRRMGLGVTGLANAGEALQLPYGSPGFIGFEKKVLDTINNTAYFASTLLAQEKGSFPLFNPAEYLKSPFIQKLPEYVQNEIAKHGIRNSHLTSIAPTGSISLAADNVSSGIEPVFSEQTSRLVHTLDGQVEEVIYDYGVRHLNVKPKTTDEVTIDEHLAVLIAAAERVDSAVSKTLTVPPGSSWEEFTAIYDKAWEGGAKGCTTFRPDGKRAGVLRKVKSETCQINPETGEKDCG